jgi:RNA polymerase sigma-70 factor, ECF subfamily
MADAKTPPDVIKAAVDGDPEAWRQIVHTWLPLVVGWCGRLGGTYVDPKDASHDVFIKAMERLHTLRNPAAFPAWLFGICRNVTRQHRRASWWRRQRWVPFLEETHADKPRFPDPDARKLMAAMDAVPDAQREAVVLCDVEGYTALEAAELAGCKVGTMKSRLRHGRMKLRKEARRRGLIPDGINAEEEVA